MTRSRCTSFLARPRRSYRSRRWLSPAMAASATRTGRRRPRRRQRGKRRRFASRTRNSGKSWSTRRAAPSTCSTADQGTTSACNDACATNWPPLENATPKAGKGAKASLVSTAPRADGTTQVVYNGHPVYTFQADTKAGSTNGQGVNAFGGLWHVVSPAGNPITKAASSGGSSTTSGGGGY